MPYRDFEHFEGEDGRRLPSPCTLRGPSNRILSNLSVTALSGEQNTKSGYIVWPGLQAGLTALAAGKVLKTMPWPFFLDVPHAAVSPCGTHAEACGLFLCQSEPLAVHRVATVAATWLDKFPSALLQATASL